MKKGNVKNSIQSRRDFFKNAAKTTLPILGAIVLANIPIIGNSSSKKAMSCETTCSGPCRGNCHGQCVDTCRGKCDTSCSGTCQGGCKFTCSRLSK
ncbi:Cys-Xaa-Xaa-Xaa repeat radical SAM target protein [Prevotella sp.]|uniref:Cys-Xaa-Xaa-Xaa repeat radical SAM target protein n=1 Tax=Prevotella sp. TaxID=59823 RepID=UPI003AB657B0